MAGAGGSAGGAKAGTNKGGVGKSGEGAAKKAKRGATGPSDEGGASKKARTSKPDAMRDHVTWLGNHNQRTCPIVESSDQEACTVDAVGKFECR